jgi:hypothetical protein
MQSMQYALLLLVGLSLSNYTLHSANADTITAKLTGLDPMASGTMVLDGTTLPSDYGVGLLEWDGTGFGNPAPFTSTFTTFCIDLNETIFFNSTYTFAINPDLASAPKSTAYVPPQIPATGMGTTRADEMMELYGSHYADLPTSDYLQAFQLAVWDIVYGSDPDSVTDTSSMFYVSGGIDATALGLANSFLVEAANPANLALHDEDDLIALTGVDGAQDQVAVDDDIVVNTSLSLPNTDVATAVLLAGLGIVRLTRSRRNSSVC